VHAAGRRSVDAGSNRDTCRDMRSLDMATLEAILRFAQEQWRRVVPGVGAGKSSIPRKHS